MRRRKEEVERRAAPVRRVRERDDVLGPLAPGTSAGVGCCATTGLSECDETSTRPLGGHGAPQ